MVENQQDVAEGRAGRRNGEQIAKREVKRLENPALSAWQEELKRETEAGAIREGKEVRRTGIRFQY